MPIRIDQLRTGLRLADGETIRMNAVELAPGEAWPIRRHPGSDMVMLFYDGSGEVRTADRVHAFKAPRHAYVPAGTVYEVRNTGDRPLRMVAGLCPPGPTEQVERHAPAAGPGGVTVLSIEQFDRFPDSGFVRGGMFFLDPGKESAYHSHDGAPEVFVFLRGPCDVTVEGESACAQPGQIVYVPMEFKHKLGNPSKDERLVVWLTVTPNVTPSHTFYEQQDDGTWRRVTPRLDGRASRPHSRLTKLKSSKVEKLEI